MVRFKNRFLLVDFLWGEGGRAPADLTSKTLDKAVKESLSRNFGVVGVACANWSLQGAYSPIQFTASAATPYLLPTEPSDAAPL
jgi:RNase P/RNase MRP subunit POP5